ncbi:vWA domain-containing protein [Shimia aestuarii]|uniref:vWA domain-containing protein n=1 Tax=Shimia aestuarii TaxID=254406 RepID=UPI001FB37190|nr:VWA domain-containing protein [Shimia aestuarii]
MSDDLDFNDLKHAMRAATPSPDARKRAENIALAQENFDRLQGSADDARPTSDARKPGLFRGVMTMLKSIPAKGALAASTALAAVGLVLVLPVLQEPPAPLKLRDTAKDDAVAIEEMEAPLVEPSIAPMAKSAPQRFATGLSAPEIRPMPPLSDSEAYPETDPNPLKVTAESPVSTFSVDVDTASYAVLRNSLETGTLPPKDAVRIEEMVNYFPYDYAAPAGDTPFATHLATMVTPWNPDTRLLRIALQGRLPDIAARPPLNLVFLIDTSGSMDAANKLPLLKQSFSLMLSELRPEDSVAIVTYAGSAGRVLDPTPASDRTTILAALDRLTAGGSTAGQAGLQQAYATAEAMQDGEEISRVILATDGDFNVGLSDPDALKDYIAKKRESGTYLSVLGFGRGNLDDATMQALAQTGNGQAAYIDTLHEARKVLVDQLTGTLFPIADDVKIQVEFNPATIAEYRLIGYETRQLNREDFNNDKVDAGEIGAGHAVTALYELTPTGSPARQTDPLRYGTAPESSVSDELGFLKLRYKAPGASTSQLIETPITADLKDDTDAQFAAAIAGFGQLLTDARYLGDWGWDEAIALATEHRGDDPFGYRTEAVRLMRLAQSLADRD